MSKKKRLYVPCKKVSGRWEPYVHPSCGLPLKEAKEAFSFGMSIREDMDEEVSLQAAKWPDGSLRYESD